MSKEVLREVPLAYVISPVRDVTPDQSERISSHVEMLNRLGFRVFNPVVDAPQKDETGYNIVMSELKFMLEASKNNGRVDILWNLGGKPSEGSRVDVGIAYALGLEFNLVEVFNAENPVGPQLVYGAVKEIAQRSLLNKKSFLLEKMDCSLSDFNINKEAIIDWDIEMRNEEQEWQRLYLGLALGSLGKVPDLQIMLGDLKGIDPPGKKSYPKVIIEIQKRIILGQNF